MKNLFLVVAALFTCYSFVNSQSSPVSDVASSSIPEKSYGSYDSIIAKAFSNHVSNLQVYGRGVVTKLLPDDNIGDRHQRFIITLSSGQTLLIAHNVDLSPRIGALRRGDTVTFYGEYEWNEKGGVLHWTHRDPNRRHVAGWLQHRGRRYW